MKKTHFASTLKFLQDLFAFLIIYCLISNYLISQSSIKFESFSKKQGISQGSILAIMQDRRGIMWFGTQDGLNKYDGYVFSVYRHNPYDINSISDNFIWSIYEDSKGMLWIGTSSGLDKFDPVYEKWSHFHNIPNKQFNLIDRIVISFCEDKTGVLWIGTKCEGLFILKNGEIKLYQYKEELSHYRIWQINEDRKGAIWFATSNGLFKYEPDNTKWIHYQNDANHPNSLSDDRVSSLYEDENGGLWIGTRNGLNYFDQKNKQWTSYLQDPQNQDSLINNNNISSICPGEKNILWIGTVNGLSKFDRDQGTWTNFEHDTQDPDSLNRNNVYSVYRDRTGKIWIGTAGGLNKVDPLKGMWTHYKNKPNDPNSLNDNFVTAIYEDREGVLWIGTAVSGLNKLNRKNSQWKLYTHDPHNPNSLSNNVIRTIYEDRANQLWIGTEEGLNKFDRKKEKWTIYKHDANNQNSLSENRVRVIFEDKTGGFWIGTWEGGISRFDREKENWIHYKNDPDYPKGASTGFIRSILEDNSGILWIGTDYGLIKLDKEKENWTHYKKEMGNPNSLSNNSIMSICEDNDEKLWIGTRIGLNSFDKDEEKWSLYTEKNGLPGDLIQNVLKDNQGYIWISTNSGLSRLNPGTLVFKNYDESDGLQGQEFIEGAFFNQKTGEIFLGATNGFVAFYPEKIKSNLHIPPVIITSFKVFDKKINISSIKEIELPYDQNFISFEFSALDYTTPEKNRYAFKMIGVDEKWNYRDSSMRFASYTKLPAGTYVFRVKGSNNDNVWNEEGIFFKVVITPPWWKTWWAYILYVVVFFMLAITIHKLIVRQLERRKEKLEELVKQRTRELAEANESLTNANIEINTINEDLKQSLFELSKANELKSEFLGIAAHDLKNPLNVIIGYSSLLEMKLKEGGSYKELKEISITAEKMLNTISELLESATVDNGDMKLNKTFFDATQLVESVVQNHKPIAEKKGQNILFSPKKECLLMGDKLILMRVIENLLSNAIKYSPREKSIWVSIEETKQVVLIKVKDEGPGLTTEDKKNLFKKFQRLSAKPTGGESATGLGLAICKRYVELHNGRIYVESKKNIGSTFVVELPIAGIKTGT